MIFGHHHTDTFHIVRVSEEIKDQRSKYKLHPSGRRGSPGADPSHGTLGHSVVLFPSRRRVEQSRVPNLRHLRHAGTRVQGDHVSLNSVRDSPGYGRIRYPNYRSSVHTLSTCLVSMPESNRNSLHSTRIRSNTRCPV